MSLKAYDAAGKLVKSLTLRSRPPALCSVSLRPGVYFIRLEEGSASVTREVVVLD